MYQNYLFDLYGTLIDIHTDEKNLQLWERLAEFYGFQGAYYTSDELEIRYAEICEQLRHQPPFYEYKEIELEKVFGQLYRDKGVKTCTSLLCHTAQVFRLLSTQYISVYDGVFELLKMLQEKEKKIYLVSNAQRCFTEYELRYLNLYHWFDGIVISSDVGCTKPEDTIFEYTVNKYQLKKEECVMIGNDAISDIFGAKNAGIDGIYIHSNLSPEAEEVQAVHKIMDGNIYRLKEYIEAI